jgi:hypothetical protein
VARSATGTVDGRAARRKLERVATMFFGFLVRSLQTCLGGEVGGEAGHGSSGSGTLLKMALQKSWMSGFWPTVSRAEVGSSTEEQGASLIPSTRSRDELHRLSRRGIPGDHDKRGSYSFQSLVPWVI